MCPLCLATLGRLDGIGDLIDTGLRIMADDITGIGRIEIGDAALTCDPLTIDVEIVNSGVSGGSGVVWCGVTCEPP